MGPAAADERALARLEARRSACVERLLRRGDALGAGVVRQVDQHAARIARAGYFAHLAALVEQVLQNLVGLELNSVRLVHGPPEQLVALATGDKAGFGEAGGCRRHATSAWRYRAPRASCAPARPG